ncbi:MAG: TonB-dependent receptor [Myxococcota bacterium]
MVLLLFSPLLHAADDVIVITATRTPTEIADAARAVDVVTLPDVDEQQARDLPEAIEQTPGVFMQRTNRGAGAPFIRGLVGPQNLVVVDGLSHNLSTYRTGPNQYLALIDPLGGDRVEIVRGPSSVLYGNGAMGGVIQVISETPTLDGWEGRLALRGASADQSGGADARLRLGNGRAGIDLSGGYTDYNTLRVGGGDREPLSDFQRASWKARGHLDLGSGHSLDAGYRTLIVDDAGRTDAISEGEVRFYDNTDATGWLGYSYQGEGRIQRARLRVGGHRWIETQDRYRCVEDAPETSCLDRLPDVLQSESLRTDQVDAIVAAGEVQLEPVARIALTVGGDHQQEWVRSERADREPGGQYEDQDRGNFSPGSRYRVSGAFAAGEGLIVRFAEGRSHVLIRAGARMSAFGADAEDVPLPDEPEGAVTYRFGGLVGSGGLSLKMKDKIHIWGSVLQGFRAPNLEETTIFGPEESRFSVPNANLRPERSDTLEAGVRARGSAITGSVVGWQTWIQDALADAPTTYNGAEESDEGLIYSNRINVPGAIYRGAEASGEVRFGWTGVQADVAWTWGQTDTEDGDTEPARRVPPLFGGVGVRVGPPGQRWWSALIARAAGPQERLSSGDRADLRICPDPDRCDGTPGWVRLDVRGGYALTDALTINLSVRNVLDARYRTHGSGIDAPGIDARALLIGSFGKTR